MMNHPFLGAVSAALCMSLTSCTTTQGNPPEVQPPDYEVSTSRAIAAGTLGVLGGVIGGVIGRTNSAAAECAKVFSATVLPENSMFGHAWTKPDLREKAEYDTASMYQAALLKQLHARIAEAERGNASLNETMGQIAGMELPAQQKAYADLREVVAYNISLMDADIRAAQQETEASTSHIPLFKNELKKLRNLRKEAQKILKRLDKRLVCDVSIPAASTLQLPQRQLFS